MSKHKNFAQQYGLEKPAELTTLPPALPAPKPVTQWEYTMTAMHFATGTLLQELNTLGKAGWECIGTANNMALLKRKLP